MNVLQQAAAARADFLRSLPSDERIAILMRDFFAPPPPTLAEYETTLATIAEEMAA